MSKHPMIFFWIVIISFTQAKAQQDSLPTEATLDQCVRYALQHQPAINQSYIDEKIVNAEIKSRIADWYPQIGFDYTLQHYFKTPVSIINGNPVATAQKNYSTAFFSGRFEERARLNIRQSIARLQESLPAIKRIEK